MADDKFQYTYSAPTESERREIEDIRKTYADAETGKGAQAGRGDKMEQLRALHRKVTRPATAVLASCLALGILLFGVGMSVVLTLENFYIGVPVGVMGIALLCAAHPLSRAVLKGRKAKYGNDILRLSEELLGGER